MVGDQNCRWIFATSNRRRSLQALHRYLRSCAHSLLEISYIVIISPFAWKSSRDYHLCMPGLARQELAHVEDFDADRNYASTDPIQVISHLAAMQK